MSKPGGYRGVDTLTELVPSSMQRYVDELREDGFIAEMSAIDAEAKELEAVKTALLSTHASICTGITSLWSAMSKHTSSTTSLASQPPSLPPFPATSTAGQASNQPPHQITPQNNSQIVSGAAQPTTSQATTQANQQTTSQNNQDDKKRFLVLCLKKGIYHRYRKHLDVTNIKSDQELFTEMQQEYSVERNWAKKWLSLKSVKSITFVVVSSLT